MAEPTGRPRVPDGLRELARLLRIEITSWTESGWVATGEFDGLWPPPGRETHFGKGSSCVIGDTIPVSCTELELALRARPEWSGGWVRDTYRPDRRFPNAWRAAHISGAEAAELIARRFPNAQVSTVSGIPDVVLARRRTVYLIECKRLPGRYRDADCTWKPYKGDGPQATQLAWAHAAREGGIEPSSLVTLWWTRRDIARCR